MKRESLLLVATFGACALGGSLWNGCVDDCRCPETTRLPEATDVLPALRVRGRDQPEDPPVAVVPTPGSLQITGETVVVTYRQGGVDHRVVYDIIPNAVDG